jgi:hypothetical protein
VRKFEIGRFLHFKSEISDWTAPHTVQFPISDFGYFGSEMQESSNFKFPSSHYTPSGNTAQSWSVHPVKCSKCV